MHPAVFEAFDHICRRRSAGRRVLEVGVETVLVPPRVIGSGIRE